MQFNDFKELFNAFLSESIKLDNTMVVGDYTYTMKENFNLAQMFNEGVGVVLYVPEDVKAQEAIALLWEVNSKNAITPTHAQFIPLNELMTEQTEEKEDPRIIGDVVGIRIPSLPGSKELRGKVDTGATISSLHADRYKIQGKMVEFVCPQLSSNVITVPLSDQQAVKSADGGTEYRPVIELNIKINDRQLNNCQFNLNDRGSMDHPVLVGQNILEKGGFLIDPRINESEGVNWKLYVETAHTYYDELKHKNIKEFQDFIKDRNLTFEDVFLTNPTEE